MGLVPCGVVVVLGGFIPMVIQFFSVSVRDIVDLLPVCIFLKRGVF